MQFLRSDWCGLSWTTWKSFSYAQALKELPTEPGVYRVRATGIEELFYVGETGRDLRERVQGLRTNTFRDVMPFNDPHTAAPSLWAWRNAENLFFECSVAPIALADESEEARRRREGLECYLLWQYRLEHHSSTRCNHGRFHPRYTRSKSSKSGIRGERLPDNAPDNIDGGPSLLPLQFTSTPLENNWMGLAWQAPKSLSLFKLRGFPNMDGVYKIFDPDTKDLLYIGESHNLKIRLTTHRRTNWKCSDPLFSFAELPQETPKYQLHEIENDLLGGFYALTQTAPKFQFQKRNAQRREETPAL